MTTMTTSTTLMVSITLTPLTADVLDSFNKPKSALGKRPQGASTSASASPAPKAPAPGGPSAEGSEEFEAQLIEGMESLLRQLANENPPGPMAGETSAKAESPKKLSAEEEEKAFQQALEAMLSGEGLEALGVDKKNPKAPPKPAGKPTSFEETIKKAMENINQGGSNAGGGSDGMPGDLAALLQQLSTDPSALDGLEGLGDDDDELGGLLDGMMAQLMSKEVLEEPMAELAQKYPEYLANPPKDVSAADIEKYKKQHELVKQIVDVFKRPNYEDSVDGKEVARLVGEMQDLGGPPNEIMGELPEGFDLGALAGNEGCVVM